MMLCAATFAGADEPSVAVVQETRFTYRTEQGVVFEVTADRLSRIEAAGRTLAADGWSVFDAGGWFTKDGSNGSAQAGESQEHSLEVVSPTRAIVRQRKDDLVCALQEDAK